MRKIVGVVDDSPVVLEAIGRLLQAAGYQTEMFSSAEALLEAASGTAASCFVIDIYLPGITGIEAGRQLVARGFRIPIIFMSGAIDQLTEGAAAEPNCIAFLHKPFAPHSLLEAIETTFRPPAAPSPPARTSLSEG